MRAYRNDCDMALRQIVGYAQRLGLMGQSEYLTLTLGNDTTPQVYAYDAGTRRNRRPSFLPTFHRGRRTTITETWVILCATRDALAAVTHQFEQDLGGRTTDPRKES